jgi:predicted transcriptional regulator
MTVSQLAISLGLLLIAMLILLWAVKVSTHPQKLEDPSLVDPVERFGAPSDCEAFSPTASAGAKRTVPGVHFRMEMSDDLNKQFSRVAKESGTTEAEIVRKALQLFFAAYEASKAGDKVGVVDESQRSALKTEFTGLYPV